MARFLAIEWDEYEVRAVEADIGNGRSAVHRVLRAALPRHEGSPTVADVSAALRSAFGADAKVPKEAVLVVPREALLVKALTLPLAPPEELPTMVRYQMVRELNLSLEGAALDFVPLPGSAAMDQQQVLAAALPADALARHHDVARQLGVHPTAMPPRPLAVAELLRAEHSGKSDRVASPPSDDAVLVIDFSTTSAELTVLVSGQVAFTRSHRFSEPVLDAAFPAAVVARETRRTLAALPSHFPNHPVGRVVILGDPAGQAALAQAVSEQAELPVDVVDPFQRASVAGNVDLPAGARGRFGALMGAVLGQASGRKPAMDFLNPRQPPVRRSRRKLYTAAAVAAAVIVAVSSYGLVRAELARRDRDIQRLNQQIANLDRNVQAGDPLVKSADAVRQWVAGEEIWLDELRAFAELFPENRDAYLEQLRLSVDPASNRGKITFSAFAKDQKTITAIEEGLRRRREQYRLHPKKNRPSSGQNGYTRQFEMELTLVDREATDSVAQPNDSPEGPLGEETSTADEAEDATAADQQPESPDEGEVVR